MTFIFESLFNPLQLWLNGNIIKKTTWQSALLDESWYYRIIKCVWPIWPSVSIYGYGTEL